MRSILAIMFVLSGCLVNAQAEWDLSRHAIPPHQIQAGGPPRDGIPALFEPGYLAAEQATDMRADEQVIGVYRNGIARAYPIRILSWHELVNDSFGPEPLLVSW
jgi:hypothetical protein